MVSPDISESFLNTSNCPSSIRIARIIYIKFWSMIDDKYSL